MKTRNTTVKNIEVRNGVGYFDIDCGRFGQMWFEFRHDWIIKEGEVDGVNVRIGKYDMYSNDEEKLISSKHLNKRNTKLICEYIESVLLDDPYDYEYIDILEDEEEERLYWQELARDDNYFLNM